MYDAVMAPGGGNQSNVPATQMFLKLSYFVLPDFINYKFKNFKFLLIFLENF